MALAVAAPAAAQPVLGSLDAGSLSQGNGQEQPSAQGSLDQDFPPLSGSQDPSAGGTGSVTDGDAPSQAPSDTTATPQQGTTYAETPGAPGKFNPDAIGELSPQTIGAVGAVTSAAVGSTVLSLGPYGPSTGSALIGGLLPGVAYVPAAGSLGSAGSGEFTTSVGVAVSENTIFQGAVGIGTTVLTGYFEGMAKKQDAAELTEADIELWDGVINSIDELRAVASLPPIERSDPRKQVALPEPCRRGFAEKEEIDEDEADELCEQAMAEQEAEQEAAQADDTDESSAPSAIDENDDDTDGPAAADTGDADTDDEATAGQTTGDAVEAGHAAPAHAGAGAQLANANADQRTDEPTVIAAEPQLANTGVDALALGGGALALIAVGGAFVLLGRRRENG